MEMSIDSLFEAVEDVSHLFEHCSVNRVSPAVDGIVFELSNDTYVKWFYETHTHKQYDKNAWRRG